MGVIQKPTFQKRERSGHVQMRQTPKVGLEPELGFALAHPSAGQSSSLVSFSRRVETLHVFPSKRQRSVDTG
jgi:hypothetical protein